MAYVIPEVFADAVNAALGVKLRVGNLATDYTGLINEITTYGDEVHFPVIDRITDAAVVTPGTAMEPDAVSMTDSTAEIKQVGKSVRIYDKYSVQVKGELKDRLAEQLGESMAKAVDADLVNSIRNEAAYKDSTLTELTQTDVDAAFNVFGDDVDNDTFAGILINSRLRSAFMTMDAFVDATKTYAANGNGIVKDGIIGYWNGDIPVYVSNNGTYADNKSMLAIVKKDALGVIWQTVPTIEEEREAKLLATDLVASEMYATKLVHTDGVSVLEIAAA
jgi:N4-gp56 family major capsid protein